MMKRPITILNLSDLHINADKLCGREALDALPCGMEAYVNEKTDRLKWLPDYIAIPGDVIDCATKDPVVSYDKATEILDGFLARFSTLSKHRIIAVPGNHDRKTLSNSDIGTDEKLKAQQANYELLKKNLDELCGNEANGETMTDFLEFHEKDFESFSDFNKRFISPTEYRSYYDASDSPVRFITGLRVFPDHKVCFLCLNTEWLYTREKIKPEKDREIHLDAPAVKMLTGILNAPEFADYTVITLMHRKPDDLSWRTKNHTDKSIYDSLCSIERHSDIIISGHDHPIRTNRPDRIKNQIQHFKLGSPSCAPKGNELFPYSVSAIHVDPIGLNVELLTGAYDDLENKWDFKTGGIFSLRNKYSVDHIKYETKSNWNIPVQLKARSGDPLEITRVIRDYFYKNAPGDGVNDAYELKAILADDLDTNMLIPVTPTHLVIYAFSADEPVLKSLGDRCDKLNDRQDVHEKKLLRKLIISRVIIKIPQSPDQAT